VDFTRHAEEAADAGDGVRSTVLGRAQDHRQTNLDTHKPLIIIMLIIIFLSTAAAKIIASIICTQ